MGVPRLVLTFAAFFGAGLYVFESARSRRIVSEQLEEIEKESMLRKEDQLEFLINSSPASILTMDADGTVLLANEAAHCLLGVPPRKLPGQVLTRYLPALKSVPQLEGGAPLFRTTMECRGQRLDGDFFPAQIWFSTYHTISGCGWRPWSSMLPRSCAIGRSSGFSICYRGSKILVGVVCHEIRFIRAAIGVVKA